MAVQGGEDVYVTLLLSDSYLPGALVLAHSLRDAGTKKKLAVMVTLDSVSAEVVTQLKSVYDHIISVPRIKNEKPANLYLMNRPDLHSAFTKVNLWKQTQFRKLVYIDADVIAYRAPDELFDLPHSFAAAPDIGWPDLFNTGVMVLSPDMGDYYALLAMADRGISFDGADQGLLNMHFKNSYHRLPFTYNVTPSAHYQYIPAYRHFQSSINMVHFIGPDKPWALGRDANTGDSPFNEMVGRWWAVYDRHYRKEETSTASHHQRPPPPEIVQHFVKGEFQPRISYVLPIGEPSQDPGVVSHGQHYEYPAQHQHSIHHEHHHYEPHHPHHHHHHQHYHEAQQHHETPQAQYQQAQPHHLPPPDEHHHQHQHQHQEYHHQHHPEQHYPPPQHHVPEQSQPGVSHPPQQSFSTPSASFSSVPETQAEARKEQVSEHHPPGPPHHEPEHKQEPPRPPEQPSWDAQRHPPPADSRPEALNFPQTHYEMSSDAAPFVPPERYPSPPRNMWYEVPREPPAPPSRRPVPIFPWERHQPRASRTFAHAEFAPEPSVSDESKAESLGESTVEPKSEPTTPTTPTIRVTTSDPWTSFTRTNAWDEVPEIERYVDALQKHRRARSQGASAAGGLRLSGLGLGQEGQRELQESFGRRGSKVTDFPSAVERPSLPVTPAPIRRPKFWGVGGPGFGDEADEDDQLLPAAEGVPPQSDWDPVAQLQKLAKQQSEALLMKLGGGAEEGTEGAAPGAEPREIPTRPLPFGSEDIRSPTYVAQSAVLSPQPVKSPRSVQSLLVGSDQAAATPRSAPETAAASSGPIPETIPEPSYRGPGAAWEKDENMPDHGVKPALPTDEERDVLET